jgi:hypothetical protein
MTAVAMRKKLHYYIDSIQDKKLPAIEPILELLADGDWTPVLETDLTPEEEAVIAEGDRQLKEHPEAFVSLEDLKCQRPPLYTPC